MFSIAGVAVAVRSAERDHSRGEPSFVAPSPADLRFALWLGAAVGGVTLVGEVVRRVSSRARRVVPVPTQTEGWDRRGQEPGLLWAGFFVVPMCAVLGWCLFVGVWAYLLLGVPYVVVYPGCRILDLILGPE
jgi:hypothetical protein